MVVERVARLDDELGTRWRALTGRGLVDCDRALRQRELPCRHLVGRENDEEPGGGDEGKRAIHGGTALPTSRRSLPAEGPFSYPGQGGGPNRRAAVRSRTKYGLCKATPARLVSFRAHPIPGW